MQQQFKKQALNYISLMRYAPEPMYAEQLARYGALLEELPAVRFKPHNLQAALIDAAVRSANVPLVTESTFILDKLRLSKNLINQITDALKHVMRRGTIIEVPTRHIFTYKEAILPYLAKVLRTDPIFDKILSDPTTFATATRWPEITAYTFITPSMYNAPLSQTRYLAQPIILKARGDWPSEYTSPGMTYILHEAAHPIAAMLHTEEPIRSWINKILSQNILAKQPIDEFLTQAIATSAAYGALTNYIERKALESTFLDQLIREALAQPIANKHDLLALALKDMNILKQLPELNLTNIPRLLETKPDQMLALRINLGKLSDVYSPPQIHRILRRFFENIEDPSKIIESVELRNKGAAKGLENAWDILTTS